MGGTIRAAINLAGYLADHKDVEIISTYRRREEPYFAFDPRVKVTPLDDERKGATPLHLRPLRAVLRRVPSALWHPADIRKHNHSLWTDIHLVRLLRRRAASRSAAGPATTSSVADLKVPGLVAIGLEQMNLRSHAKNMRKAMLRRYRDLDGLAVLTEQDRQEYEAAMDGTAPPMWRIPNTVARVEPPRADLSAQRIFAAGRYTAQKGYDMLIPAFAPVAAQAPRVGAEAVRARQGHDELRAQIAEQGLEDRVMLDGPTDDVPGRDGAGVGLRPLLALRGLPARADRGDEQGHGVRRLRLPDGPGRHRRRPPQRAARPGPRRRGR